MKINVLSDLHLEFGNLRWRPIEDCQVVILAGDIGVGFMALQWIDRMKITKHAKVFYLPGNHEFYGWDINEYLEKFDKKCEQHGVISLNNRKVEIDGSRILGATLWTDYNLYGNQPLSMLEAQDPRFGMNDFKQIRAGRSAYVNRLTTDRVLEEHTKSIGLIKGWLEEPFEGKTIIATHHLPSEQSCDPRYENDMFNPCYASRLENLILAYNPALWIHGHVHVSNDYMIGDTRIISNPRGYARYEVNPNFLVDYTVEV